jgi:threonine/homoserine/homoserine lactone efflux protein
MWVYLLQGLSLGISAAASPGPFQAFVISQSLRHGWRRTLPVSLAPLLSDGPIIALVLLVLTSLPPVFLRVIQVLGGLFVLYLAYRSYLAYRRFRPVEVQPEAAGKNLLQAIITNFLSPGPYIFWSLLAGPVLVRGWNETPLLGVSFVSGFYLAMVSGLVLLIVLFGAARQLGPRANRALLGLSALALMGFGLYQLASGILAVPL